MTWFIVLLTGFLLGIKHATDADHLAAVATLATRQNSLAQTLQQGIAWGVGHTFTLLLFGSIILALGTSMPQYMEQALELCVGFMLIALGADVLYRLVRRRMRFHAHSHGHINICPTAGNSTPTAVFPLRALAVGMMHGMAGSAALILLSLGTVQSLSMGIVYLTLFGAGSIVGMALLSVAMAVPLRLAAGFRVWLHYAMTGFVGAVSCLLGASIVYRIGYTNGFLFG